MVAYTGTPPHPSRKGEEMEWDQDRDATQHLQYYVEPENGPWVTFWVLTGLSTALIMSIGGVIWVALKF